MQEKHEKRRMKRRATSESVENDLRVLEEQFMADVSEGYYQVGDTLPSFRGLRQKYGCTKKVAERFYQSLKERNNVLSLPRKGMVLTDAAIADSTVPGRRLVNKGILVIGWLESDNFKAEDNRTGQALRAIDDECFKGNIPLHFYNLYQRFHNKMIIKLDQIDFERIVQYEAMGVIVIPDGTMGDEENRDFWRNLPVPSVAITEKCAGIRDCLISDDVANGYKATRHLLELGHRKIAFIAYDVGKSIQFNWQEKRIDGFFQALHEYDIERDTHMVFSLPYAIFDLKELITKPLYKLLPEIYQNYTAVICGSDVIGALILDYEKEHKLSPKRSLSFVTFDDYWRFRSYDMSAIRVTGEVQGRAGFQALVKKILTGECIDTIGVSGNLYKRSTSLRASFTHG